MNFEKIILKKSPSLEFSFNENSFQIINEAEPESEGIYEYDSLKSIGFEKERTNWILTILSYLIELFAGVGGGGTYKNKKILTINQVDKKIKLDLLDCEQKAIDELIAKLESIGYNIA